jgi:hypothetical protein
MIGKVEAAGGMLDSQERDHRFAASTFSFCLNYAAIKRTINSWSNYS